MALSPRTKVEKNAERGQRGPCPGLETPITVQFSKTTNEKMGSGSDQPDLR